MKLGKTLGILGGIVAIVGAVLPWWNLCASAGAISVCVPVLGIFTLGGILCLVFGILGMVFALLKNPVLGIVASVMGLLVVVMAALYGAFFPTASLCAGGACASVSAGFGYWIALLGGILLLAAGPLVYMDNKSAATAPPMPVPPA